MASLNRRQFLQSLGLASAASAVLTFPGIIKAATTRPHIVVIGGGFAGATAAKYLRYWSTAVDVTLVEPNTTYYSPILSNLVLTNQRNLGQISFNYNTLASKYGVKVVHDWVESINAPNQTVNLRGGTTLAYDRLIIAPGIEFMPVAGLDSNKVPHAWKAGAQTILLQQQLAAMPAGGTFVLTIPAAPYRCPPGPYERACVVADWLRTNKPGSKVVVLDANPAITVEAAIFGNAFASYGVQYVPNAALQGVDSDAKIAHTSAGDFKADVLNVIPPHRAGSIVLQSGLANVGGRWAGVNPLSYESTAVPHIHIIGDSQAQPVPKAGHIANAEAKVCADAVLRLLSGGQPYPAPMTNSACYSPISASTASWLTAVYAYDQASGVMKLVPESLGSAPFPSNKYYNAMFEWTTNLFNDTFA
ncbi:MAG: NAD(P)/FAD-dependent oxidoreductase [Thiothrix sp.]